MATIPINISHASFETIHQKDNTLIVKINEGFTSNDILQFFIAQQVAILSYNEILPSLNDIFIRLVEGTAAKTRAFKEIDVN